jgi:predicted DNA-binding transcriptional regulator YafY
MIIVRLRAMSTDRPRSIDEQLRFAIAYKRLIQLGYAGRLRAVEPHDYGVQKGSTMLLAYQRRESGDVQRKSVMGWRLFDVSKIETCAILDETFPGSRGESHQHHYTWDVLYARVT